MQTDQDQRKRQLPAGFNSMVLVTWLMVLVIITLTWLWIRDRRRLTAAQAQIQQLTARNEVMSALGGLLEGGFVAPVDRQSLPTTMADFEGQSRQVLELDWAAGKRLGFEEGDLIQVRFRPPSSAPSAD